MYPNETVSRPSKAKTATITSGQSLSAAVEIVAQRPVKLNMPAAWTAASITFQVSTDGSTFRDLYDVGGTEYALTVAASRCVILNPDTFTGAKAIKVRSGPTGAAVNQGADRAIEIVIV